MIQLPSETDGNDPWTDRIIKRRRKKYTTDWAPTHARYELFLLVAGQSAKERAESESVILAGEEFTE